VLRSPALFLSAGDSARSTKRLAPRAVDGIWTEMDALVGIARRMPHSAWHTIDHHIMQETGNLAAVQRQLGRKCLDYSAEHARFEFGEA
jgi:site-specific recombinase XerC